MVGSLKHLLFTLAWIGIIMAVLLSIVAVGSATPQPPSVLTYHGDGFEFAFRRGDVFVGNDTYLSEDVTITISFEPINSTASWIYVDIRAPAVYYWPHRNFVFRGIWDVECNESADWRSVRTIMHNYHLRLKYLVNTTNNYAWLNGEFIGFFPFYIFPTLGYDNVTKYTYVYMGKELHVAMLEGKPGPSRLHVKGASGREYEIVALTLYNKYINIGFVYHWPISVTGFIPIGNNTYLHIDSATIDEDWIPYLKAIDDYPEWVTTIDWSRLILFIAIIGSIIALVIMFIRRRRRHK
ncbi:hypothetical protein [Staphylothermus hellenicus]|uniref:Uncharacterized protein n=1 Tax=Staphylothermus hellenicus (strain DSM 12710 / JCM 10830 / BK20S6-10-b1 / P8) TaxID=591019 RepID=D7DBX9_STAHD|nr:hypothetical protein [Staphylothermus hellenicus]ADI31676.1 hypothetical protein Shell_0547 [Staphylothermus hellenicus DSM 12710]